mmetsp:Transcript_73704/g.146086  ORF Transcript_73704/g.146086 Transcript_73704/m.146086 type:complete len:221 (+) Transcript_73704:345-1007(+)
MSLPLLQLLTLLLVSTLKFCMFGCFTFLGQLCDGPAQCLILLSKLLRCPEERPVHHCRGLQCDIVLRTGIRKPAVLMEHHCKLRCNVTGMGLQDLLRLFCLLRPYISLSPVCLQLLNLHQEALILLGQQLCHTAEPFSFIALADKRRVSCANFVLNLAQDLPQLLLGMPLLHCLFAGSGHLVEKLRHARISLWQWGCGGTGQLTPEQALMLFVELSKGFL